MLVLAAAWLIGSLTLRPQFRVLIPWIAIGDALFGKVVQLASRAFQGAGEMSYCARLTAFVYAARAALAAGLYLYARYWGGHPNAYTWGRIYWLAPFAVSILAFWLITSHLGWPRSLSILASREKYSANKIREGYSQADPGASVPRANFTPK